jgi:DNA-binding NtrC family response regulator
MCPVTTFPPIAGNGGALIATPSGALREQVLRSLDGRWRPVDQVTGGAEALAKLEQGDWQVLFLDRRIPDLASEELAAIIQKKFPGIQLVLLDSASPIPAVEFETAACKPPNIGQEERSQRIAEIEELKDNKNKDQREGNEVPADSECQPLPGMIGRSEAMRRVYRMAQLVAPRTTTVLIVGATGSGKELVARALHTLSPRAAKPFIAVNCAAIPEALLESELFGHARGAFTGAVQAQLGRIASAHGGTLFLDEISELPLAMQAKLLRFLEQKEVQRLGTVELTRVDVRVIAASNVDMAARAGTGEFREDLFYRLSAFPLHLPPLSERRADIVPLAEHFLACMAAAMNVASPRISAEAARILEAHPWKGNVRELQHVMERASILVENKDTVLSEHLYFPFQQTFCQAPSGTLSCAARAS